MFLNEPVLNKAREPNALLAFFHTQRTGGSNLQRWLRTRFSDEEVYSSRTVDNYVHWQKLPSPEITQDFKLVAGFAEFREYDLGRPVVCLGTIRHPFYRVVSLYGMSRRHTGHFMHDVAKDGSFEEFYAAGAERNPVYFHNLMTRRLGGYCRDCSYKADLELAKANLEAHFGMVMPTNHLHEATELLATELGWDIDPMKANGAPLDPENYASFDESPARDTILEHNQMDLDLFEFVASGVHAERERNDRASV